MSIPMNLISLLPAGRREPRSRASYSSLSMRGLSNHRRLWMPSEQGSSVEGAYLNREDIASRLSRRPSPERPANKPYIRARRLEGDTRWFWLALCASSRCSADLRLERREQQQICEQ